MEYLGHFIYAEGVATNPKKIVVVWEWPNPNIVKEMRGFKIFQKVWLDNKLLADLFRKEGFIWNNKATMTFNQLKEAFISARVLNLPSNILKFVVMIDACDTGIGTFLMQEGHPLAYQS